MSSSDLFSSHHPVWNILRIFVVFIGLTVLLYLNAETFDETEFKTVLELIGLIAGFEFVKHKVGQATSE